MHGGSKGTERSGVYRLPPLARNNLLSALSIDPKRACRRGKHTSMPHDFSAGRHSSI